MNTNRGHETQEHRALKAETIQFLKRWGYTFVLCEHQNSDVIAIRPHSNAILGAEIERSVRNLLKNVSRDFSLGCTHLLIVCPDFKITGQIARKLDRELSSELREKVGLITTSALRMLDPGQP